MPRTRATTGFGPFLVIACAARALAGTGSSCRAGRIAACAALVVFACAALVPVHGARASTGGAYVVHIPLKSPAMQKALVDRGIEILALTKGGYVDALVEEKDLRFVMTLGVPVSIISAPEMPGLAAPAIDANLGLYHTYAEMETVLTQLETTYPTLAHLFTIGTSIEGRNIYVLKISDNVAVDEDEPEVLYMGDHHARELMSVEIPLKFAQYLLTNYGVDPDVTNMVDTREIFIAPMINPDGHYYVQLNHSGSSDYWWRKNRRYNYDGSYGVDLNRNYGYMWGYDNVGSSPTPNTDVYRGTGPFSEPETQAVRDFAQGRHLILALSYHSYGELLLYPWGYAPILTPDNDLFAALGDTLAYGTGYQVGTSPALLYATNGDSDDWAYGETTQKDKIFCFTPEVNSSAQGGFAPAESYIQPTFNSLLAMNMNLLHFADNPYRVLPPERPTQYAIDDSQYPYYTLSWSSSPPSDPNPAVSYDVVEYKNLGTIAQDPANAQTGLWMFDGFSVSTARKYEGTASYYSGRENAASHTLQMSTFYRVTAATDTFTARMWYDIESGYDYAYLEKSADGGRTWETLPGNVTTNSNPYGNNRGNGITGSSGGFVFALFPLTSFLGEEFEMRFNYVTDAYVTGEGLYVDLPGPVSVFDRKTIVANAIPDTTLDMTPNEEATFTYRVRGRDAENQASFWSASRSITIDNLTAIEGRPVLASRLGVNYPNPFNPTTRIPYAVGAHQGANVAVPVRLAIYDVAGRRVATLVDRALPPGPYEAVWDGRSDRGGPAPSGVYFARLTVGQGESFTRKLVLLK
jgi:hypothetical protein